SDKLLDLVGLGGKSAADKGKDTRDYLAAAFPELNAWERAGADASSAGMVDAGFENQKELTKMQLDNQKEDRKSGSAGMPRPISYAVFCLKKKKWRESHHVGIRCESTCQLARRRTPVATTRQWRTECGDEQPRTHHWTSSI